MLFNHKSKEKLRLDAILEKKKKAYFKAGGKIEVFKNNLTRPDLVVNEFTREWKDTL